jgi:hypothetical protein
LICKKIATSDNIFKIISIAARCRENGGEKEQQRFLNSLKEIPEEYSRIFK